MTAGSLSRLDHFHEYWQGINSLSPGHAEQLLDLGMQMPDPHDFPPAQLILDKLHESINRGDFSRYMPPEGPRECLLELLIFENSRLPPGVDAYRYDNIMLTAGAIRAFSLVSEHLLQPRDKVLVLNPSYFSLAALAEMRFSVHSILSPDMRITASLVASNLQPNTKMLFLCQPNNPTGLYIPSEDLKTIIDITASHSILLVIDETCDTCVYGTRDTLPANITQPHVIRIRSFSKEQNLAGFRIGYLIGSKPLIDRLKCIVPAVEGNPSVMPTRALTAEFRVKNGSLLDKDYTDLEERKPAVMKSLRDSLGARWNTFHEEFIKPDACYYMFVKFKFAAGSRQFARGLLHEYLVAVVPGTVFGVPEQECWVRLCFARRLEILEEGFARIERFVTDHGSNAEYKAPPAVTFDGTPLLTFYTIEVPTTGADATA